MGKRTKAKTGQTHKPRKHDLWPTIDARAIPPLLPHLPPGARYAEPMAGDGHLIDLLDPHIELAWASDIEPRASRRIHENDVLQVGLGDADIFISNPPWSRALLHKVIVHLSDLAPTFLLYDADWMHTNQAGAFMERCRKIIHVGRLLWIPDTTNTGFTSCCWYEFGRPITGSAPLFFGHGGKPAPSDRRAPRLCADCGAVIDRFGKWRLVERGGRATPAHWNCDSPSHPFGAPQPAPCPLLEWGAIS